MGYTRPKPKRLAEKLRRIREALGLSQSGTSHHLRTLRNLRLVKHRRAGRLVYYSLDDSHIVGLFAQGLEHVLENGRREHGGDH